MKVSSSLRNFNLRFFMSRKEGKARVITETELKRVLNYQASQKHGLRNICILNFSFFLGLRAKELAGLSIGDVTSENNFEELKEEVVLIRDITKGRKQRSVFLTNPKVRNTLTEYLNQRKIDGEEIDPNSPLFRSQKNLRFTNRTLAQLLNSMFDAVGISGTSHSGRRTFATSLLSGGINIRNVQTLLGHSSITTTSLYCDTNPRLLGDISRNIKLVQE